MGKQQLIDAERALYKALYRQNNDHQHLALQWLENGGVCLPLLSPLFEGIRSWLNQDYQEVLTAIKKEKEALNNLALREIAEYLPRRNGQVVGDGLAQECQTVIDDNQQSASERLYNISEKVNQSTNNPSTGEQCVIGWIQAVRGILNWYLQQSSQLENVQQPISQVQQQLEQFINEPNLPNLEATYVVEKGHQDGNYSSFFKQLQQTIVDSSYSFLNQAERQLQAYQQQRLYTEQDSNYQYLRSKVIPQLRQSLAQCNQRLIAGIKQAYEQQEEQLSIVQEWMRQSGQSDDNFNSDNLDQFKQTINCRIEELQQLDSCSQLSSRVADKWYKEFTKDEGFFREFLEYYQYNKDEYQCSHYVRVYNYLAELIRNKTAGPNDRISEPTKPEGLFEDPGVLYENDRENDYYQNVQSKLQKLNYEADSFLASTRALQDIIIYFAHLITYHKDSSEARQILARHIQQYLQGQTSKDELKTALSEYDNDHAQELFDKLSNNYWDNIPATIPRQEQSLSDFPSLQQLSNRYEDAKNQCCQSIKQKATLSTNLIQYPQQSHELKRYSDNYKWARKDFHECQQYNHKHLLCVIRKHIENFGGKVFDPFMGLDATQTHDCRKLNIPANLWEQQQAVIDIDHGRRATSQLKAQLFCVANIKQLMTHLNNDHADLKRACVNFLRNLEMSNEFDVSSCKAVVERFDEQIQVYDPYLKPLIKAVGFSLIKTGLVTPDQSRDLRQTIETINNARPQHYRQAGALQTADNITTGHDQLVQLFAIDSSHSNELTTAQSRRLFNVYKAAVYMGLKRVADDFIKTHNIDIKQCEKRFPGLISRVNDGQCQTKSFGRWQKQFSQMPTLINHVETIIQTNYNSSTRWGNKKTYDQLKQHLGPLGLIIKEGKISAKQAISFDNVNLPAGDKTLAQIKDDIVTSSEDEQGQACEEQLLQALVTQGEDSRSSQSESMSIDEGQQTAESSGSTNDPDTLEISDDQRCDNLKRDYPDLTEDDLNKIVAHFKTCRDQAALSIYKAILRFINDFQQAQQIVSPKVFERVGRQHSRLHPFQSIASTVGHWPVDIEQIDQLPDDIQLQHLLGCVRKYIQKVKNKPKWFNEDYHRRFEDWVGDYLEIDRQAGSVELKASLKNVVHATYSLKEDRPDQQDELEQIQLPLSVLNTIRSLYFDKQLISQVVQDCFSDLAQHDKLVDKIYNYLANNLGNIQLQFAKQCVQQGIAGSDDNLMATLDVYKWHQVLQYADIAQTDMDEAQQRSSYKHSLTEPLPDQNGGNEGGDNSAEREDDPDNDVLPVQNNNELDDFLANSLFEARHQYAEQVLPKRWLSCQSYDNIKDRDKVDGLEDFSKIVFGQLGSRWRSDSLRTMTINHLDWFIQRQSSSSTRCDSFCSEAKGAQRDNMPPLVEAQDQDSHSRGSINIPQNGDSASFPPAKQADNINVKQTFINYLTYLYDQSLQDQQGLQLAQPNQQDASIQHAFIKTVVEVTFERLLDRYSLFGQSQGPQGALHQDQANVNAQVDKASKILGALEQVIQDQCLSDDNISSVVNCLHTTLDCKDSTQFNNAVNSYFQEEDHSLKDLVQQLSISSSMFFHPNQYNNSTVSCLTDRLDHHSIGNIQ